MEGRWRKPRIKSQAVPGTICEKIPRRLGWHLNYAIVRAKKASRQKNAKPDLQLWLFTVELSVFVGNYDKIASLLLFLSAIIISFVVEVEKQMILRRMRWDKCCDNAETEIWRDKTEKYDPSREVFMSEYTSDCHIATLISSGHHSTHFSSLPKNILTSAKKSPESGITHGLAIERWVARIIFGINIWAMWWRGTRHTGDETLEEAELRGTF